MKIFNATTELLLWFGNTYEESKPNVNVLIYEKCK